MTDSDANTTWLEQPRAGWTPLPLPHELLEDNFVSGDKSGRRLTVCYYRDEAASSLCGKVLFGPGTQGPPGHAHGGSMAALMDEAMGGAAWMGGHMVLAAELTTRFKRILPLGTRCVVEASVASVEGRKVRTQATLRDDSGNVFCEGEALFITLDASMFGKLADQVGAFLSPAATSAKSR